MREMPGIHFHNMMIMAGNAGKCWKMPGIHAHNMMCNGMIILLQHDAGIMRDFPLDLYQRYLRGMPNSD
jgi:hypothetical protein